MDGSTIHRLFSFSKDVSVQHVRSSAYYPGRFAKALKELDTLIVDGASMVRADLFDAMVAALERFGTPCFFSARSFARETFLTVELTTVFRQIGNDQLVNLLNGVREGALLDEARAQLNARADPDFEPDLNELWLTLATTNRIVGARNRRMLERLGGDTTAFTASVTGERDGFEHPAEDTLYLAVGAQVMLLNNEPAGRWVNGSIGRVESIREDADGPVVDVRLRDGELVDVRRHVWEITRPVVRGGSLVHETVGTFAQLPMKLAWAITIHKSQGQTLDHVVVDLTGGTFANGQLYVALSRCTSLDGLVLKRPVLPKDLKTDVRVWRFLNAASADQDDQGRVYVAALFVGTEGDRYRPRPVEIAVVTADGDGSDYGWNGDEATTVVNPTMDLYSASTEYGITTRDVQLAPLLTEAWAALSPLLAGRTPVGVGIDRTLGLIDSELKRNGVVQQMPLGAELPAEALAGAENADNVLSAPTALERARAMRDVGERLLQERPDALAAAGASTFPAQAWGSGYLLARTTGTAGCQDASGFTVGGNLSAEDDPAQALADALAGAWERVVDRDFEVVARLHDAERYFGVRILPEGFEAMGPLDADAVLVPGARVCFTGEVISPRYGSFERSEMQQLALDRGLAISESMTKTKTDVLVVAQRGTQSGKAKKAAHWGKPVLAAEEFLEWALE